ncbi:pyridoxamine 5'-phosphate oxidase family protein [Histidinibacterium lentulum]|uniref:Pyridoxamine 5'-phosphate oxidase n=1 Tax=Histidinibacterium lentulum TaxID=2480588 RepID=A0A3N2R173_9RHOB|nr:pyridoxamine 5'-phosphate oxidase family protein [Histidinibacterium lentulum]ROU01215.1 pyridoxamine 5'-phosphate oxidase [Histidinibacterium lentulum]
MNDAPETLDGFLDAAWQRLGRGAADARSPARYPVLATVSPDGWPEARTVALRAASRQGATLEVHSDVAAAKVAALRADARAALHVWDPRVRLQIRAQGAVEIVEGVAAGPRWAKVPEGSRATYGKRPPAGEEIGGALEYEVLAERESFCALVLHVATLDLLHLGERHRRAMYDRESGWRGRWLSP